MRFLFLLYHFLIISVYMHIPNTYTENRLLCFITSLASSLSSIHSPNIYAGWKTRNLKREITRKLIPKLLITIYVSIDVLIFVKLNIVTVHCPIRILMFPLCWATH